MNKDLFLESKIKAMADEHPCSPTYVTANQATIFGLKRRELFSAIAMQGLLMSAPFLSFDSDAIIHQAIKLSEALCAELDRENGIKED